MNKEMAAKASVIKVPNKLFHSPGETDTHLPIIYNSTQKINGSEKIGREKKREIEVKEKQEERFTGGRLQYKSKR